MSYRSLELEQTVLTCHNEQTLLVEAHVLPACSSQCHHTEVKMRGDNVNLRSKGKLVKHKEISCGSDQYIYIQSLLLFFPLNRNQNIYLRKQVFELGH